MADKAGLPGDAWLFDWAAPACYWVVWFTGASALLRPRYLLHAAVLATVYAGAHVYEARYRGHCGLSSDSTAFPAAAVAFLGSVWLHRAYAGWGFADLRLVLLGAGGAFAAGHLLLFAVFYVADLAARRRSRG